MVGKRVAMTKLKPSIVVYREACAAAANGDLKTADKLFEKMRQSIIQEVKKQHSKQTKKLRS